MILRSPTLRPLDWLLGPRTESASDPDGAGQPRCPATGTDRFPGRLGTVTVTDSFACSTSRRGSRRRSKVRVYTRRDHYVLQWWDPAAKATLSDRVNGDLVSAITRAREIDDRLLHYRSAGSDRGRKVSHANLVEAFQQDLVSRADAGEIDARTEARYRAALAHYLVFCSRLDVQKSCPHASKANRDFRLAFVAFLANGSDRPNGNELTTIRPMDRGGDFELDIVRAMYEWAADPDRGGLLPEGGTALRPCSRKRVAPTDGSDFRSD